MKKEFYNWADLEGFCLELARQVNADGFKPDYIVGITRGGLVPALLLSQYLSVPMETLKVSLRDGNECESNCWMSEDAFNGKNILIVDDINDSGATLAWIKNDWIMSCLPKDEKWSTIWGNNVKVAVVTNNIASAETVDYSVREVNKAENDVWLVYPWEDFWLNNGNN